MRGEILAFDASVGEGEIAGDDFARYRFSAADARSPSALRPGVRVDFTVADDRRATGVAVLGSHSSTGPVLGGNFDLGRVIQRTFGAMRQNWLVFFGAAAIMVGIPSLIMTWGQMNLTSVASSYTGPAIGALFGGLVLFVVGFYLLQAMVLKAALNGFNGKSTSLASAFDVGLKKALPLLGMAIIVGLALLIGFLLLIVPGVILCILWAVAAPVLVAEKRGVFASLQRSADLTKGHRWSVFGLLVVYAVLSWIVSAFGAGVGLAAGGFSTGAPNTAAMMVVNAVVNILSGVVASAGAASLYYELRTVKEGGGAEELAAVFD